MDIDSALIRFLQSIIQSPIDRRLSAIAQRCSQEFGIGVRVGRKYVYGTNDVDGARSLLQAHDLPLTDSGLTDRADAAARPGTTEKSGTKQPHDDSVAYRIFHSGQEAFVGYAVATASEVQEIDANILMVVENFETFRQLTRYQWVIKRLASIAKCLVVYRGDSIYNQSDADMVIKTSNLPKIGFHDFDPAGLHLSFALTNLVEHFAPPLPVLQMAVTKGKRSDLYFNQLNQYASTLDQVRTANIPELWSMMKRAQKGLPQEWMRDITVD